MAKNDKLIIGLTGGIGAGKTTVSDWFSEQGVSIVDADVVAREVVAPGSDCLHQLAEHFGSAVLHDDGSLNRSELRALMFSDENHTAAVNAIMHPMIRTELMRQLQHASASADLYCILVAPLLLENKLDALVDRVLVVSLSPEQQVQRVAKRDQRPSAEIENIIAAQLRPEQRLAMADDIIDNNGSLGDIYRQCGVIHQQYLRIIASENKEHSTQLPSQ